jgi:hypothetical protein
MLFIVTKEVTLRYVFARAHVENMQIFQHTNELNIDTHSILDPLGIETKPI